MPINVEVYFGIPSPGLSQVVYLIPSEFQNAPIEFELFFVFLIRKSDSF